MPPFRPPQALRHYGSTAAGPLATAAEALHQELRHNLMSNIVRQYQRTGYLWEQYDDSTGGQDREGAGVRLRLWCSLQGTRRAGSTNTAPGSGSGPPGGGAAPATVRPPLCASLPLQAKAGAATRSLDGRGWWRCWRPISEGHVARCPAAPLVSSHITAHSFILRYTDVPVSCIAPLLRLSALTLCCTAQPELHSGHGGVGMLAWAGRGETIHLQCGNKGRGDSLGR